jgi:hypothetical protein
MPTTVARASISGLPVRWRWSTRWSAMGSRETRVREQINFGVWAFDHQPARDLRRRPRGA